jgi:hypothetical protein
MGGMQQCSFATFAAAARAAAEEARRQRLVVPAFRTPPRRQSAHRTLRRRPDGSAVVAVRVRGRALDAVIDDIVEGVVAANGLSGEWANRCRRDVFAAV